MNEGRTSKLDPKCPEFLKTCRLAPKSGSESHFLVQNFKEQKNRRYRAAKLSMGDEGGNDNTTFPGSSGPDYFTVPIVGYEIVERRQRFTVYKIRVQKQDRSWFIFRRYSDFYRLNEKLVAAFPRINLKLPPKRVFGDNFNPEFIAERAGGLQNYIKTVLQHRDMRICRETQEFFCLDDPPGPFDSLEESRAYVQCLEEQMEDTKCLVKQLTSQLEATKSQLSEAKVQIQSLECALRNERLQRKSPNQPSHSTPAISDDLGCEPEMEVQLSDISDSYLKTKSGKKVSFPQMKAASEGNLLSLKKQPSSVTTLKDHRKFRHSITFGEDSFIYSGFIDVQYHSNLTDKVKERKRKTRKGKNKAERKECRGQGNSASGGLTSDTLHGKPSTKKIARTFGRGDMKKEKRDSGIIRDSFTDTDSC